MFDDIEHLVAQHHSKGVIFDTNLLVLILVGGFDVSFVPRFKRTNHYTIRDFEFLWQLRQRFAHNITTPSVWAEVTNWVAPLVRSFVGGTANPLGQFVRNEIMTCPEIYAPTPSLAEAAHFDRVGATDSAVVDVAQNGVLVVTTDWELADVLYSLGLACINYSQLQPFINS